MRSTSKWLAPCLLLPLLACGRIEPVDGDASDDGSADSPGDWHADSRPDAASDADDPLVDFGVDCPPVRIPFEAEDMVLTGYTTDTSFRPEIGDYITTSEHSATATIDIGIPCSDRYVLWGLIYWEGDSSDSVFWQWDSSGTPTIWDFLQCSGTSGWHWDQVTSRGASTYCTPPAEDPEPMPLREGDHTLEISPREPPAPMAAFVLTNEMDYTPPTP
jgi:hypothetical protein